LPAEDAKFSGEYIYTKTNPYQDRAWRERYEPSLTPSRLAMFYVRNSRFALRNLWRDLRESSNMRMFAYYYKNNRGGQSDVPAKSLLGWTTLRSWLLRTVPWHLPLFYGAAIATGLIFVSIAAQPWQRIGGSLSLALSGAGVSEFVVTSLFDALETQRHLFLFHVITEALIVLMFLTLAWKAGQHTTS